MSDITTKDILAWLDMQRDAVNTEIVYAAQSEKKQYHKHLEIINALAERVQEMTAVEFLKTCVDMCDGRGDCEGCALDGDDCPFGLVTSPRRAVEIVKRWKEEQDGQD